MTSPPVRRTVTAVAATLVLASPGASPAVAPPPTIDVVNLGDSYSAASGTGGRQQVAGLPGCHQGTGTDQVDELAAHPRVEAALDAACSGADAGDVQTLASVPFVHDALAAAELVTLTVGGNDARWSEIISACSTPFEATHGSGTCDTLLVQAAALIASAAAAAAATVDVLDAATDGRIVVLGYPQIFGDGQDTPLVSAERAAQLNALADELNAALESAVETEGAIFVDVSDRFRGHGLGSAEPWILFEPGNPQNLHPTETSYCSGYLPGLLRQVPLAR